MVGKIEDLRSRDELKKAIKASIASKQYGHEDLLSDLVVEAALNVMPKNPKDFNVDNIRVVKVMGSSLYESKVVRGMVFGREPEGIQIYAWPSFKRNSLFCLKALSKRPPKPKLQSSLARWILHRRKQRVRF